MAERITRKLPSRIDTLHAPDTDGTYRALGFDFGQPHPQNPELRDTTLPEGWSIRPTSHLAWNRVEDELGRERVSVYYAGDLNAVDAFMRITPLAVYLRRCRMDQLAVEADDGWALPALIVAAAQSEIARLDEQAAHLSGHALETAARDRLDSIAVERTWWTDLADRYTADDALAVESGA